ncbi:MAG: methyltransferase domain-containing protein [Solirubrobacterales bacterium]
MDELVEIKQRNRAMWATGDFDAIAELIWDVGGRLIDRLGVGPGERLLDVGAGTGNAAIPAAVAGAEVVASDLTPELFDPGRRRATEAGVELEWVEADAEALPFEDGSFEIVVSTFGHMFAPRHRVAAEEIARVTRPGGRIGLCCWDPAGQVGDFFRTIASHMPPPPEGFQPPPMWGNPAHATEMFEGTGIGLEFEHEVTAMQFADAVSATDEYAEKFGPVVMARRALEPEGRWQALHDDLVKLFEEQSTPADDGISFDAQYLVILGRKPG